MDCSLLFAQCAILISIALSCDVAWNWENKLTYSINCMPFLFRELIYSNEACIKHWRPFGVNIKLAHTHTNTFDFLRIIIRQQSRQMKYAQLNDWVYIHNLDIWEFFVCSFGWVKMNNRLKGVYYVTGMRVNSSKLNVVEMHVLDSCAEY